MFSLDTETLFSESGIPLAIMGMLVVFTALMILVGCITLLPHVIEFMEKRMPSNASSGKASEAKPKPRVKRTGGAPAGVMLGGVPEEIAVVIAAAVDAVMDQPYRIVRTRQLTASELAWTLQGRIQHHASHKLKPRDR